MDKAWGENRYTWGDTPTKRRFTGQIEDGTIGLHFYNARYHDSYLGRFIQADTIVPNPADPQDFNRYSYVGNNPLGFVDPSGHWYYDPGTDALVHTGVGYNEQPQNLYYGSPLYTLRRLRRGDNPDCPSCSEIMMPNVLNEAWLDAHSGYDPNHDTFLALVEQTFAEGEGINGLTAADANDLRTHYSLLRTAEELARGERWQDLTVLNLLQFGPPLLAAVGQAHNKLGSEAQQMMATAGHAHSARAPHGNSLSSPKPTWLYKLVDRNTGQVMKYGITSRTNAQWRYTKQYYQQNNVELVAIAQGQRWHMYQLEYQLNVQNNSPWSKYGH